MRKNFIFKMSVVFVMGIMALGQVSCSPVGGIKIIDKFI